MLDDETLKRITSLEAEGKTVVAVLESKRMLGLIALRDEPRDDAREGLARLQALGVQAALVGKTHMRADVEGMQRLGIDPDSIIGVRVAECGFDPYERDDGLHAVGPDGRYDPQVPRYNRYLNDKGARDVLWVPGANR